MLMLSLPALRVNFPGRLVGLQLKLIGLHCLNLLCCLSACLSSAHRSLVLVMRYETGAEIITTSSGCAGLQLYLGVVMSQL